MSITYRSAIRCARINMGLAVRLLERAKEEPDRADYWLAQADNADKLARMWLDQAKRLDPTDADQ